MPDRIELMLDSMITAVDEGFSYDGIVSVPETGLEDVRNRTGLAGLFDDGVDLFRASRTTISGAAARFLPKPRLPTPAEPGPPDSGVDTGGKIPPWDSSVSQSVEVSNVEKVIRSSIDGDERQPRKKDDESEERQPRGEDEQQPRKKGIEREEVARPPNTEREPRKKDDVQEGTGSRSG